MSIKDIILIAFILCFTSQSLEIGEKNKKIVVLEWALEETGRDFTIQRGMLHRCEALLSQCRSN